MIHEPKNCPQCGKEIKALQHPHNELDYVSRPPLADLGPQWTCGHATWGPADGSTFNPFELDSVP